MASVWRGTGQRDRRAHVLARRVTLLVGVAGSVVAGAVAGVEGLVSAIVATLVVVGFFWSGLVPVFAVRPAARSESPPSVAVGLALLLLTYTLRLALVFAALAVAGRVDAIDRGWLGVTIVTCALVWLAVHVGAAVSGPRRPAVAGEVAAPDAG